MSLIEITENSQLLGYQRNSNLLLYFEKKLVEYHFSWLNIYHANTELLGNGTVNINGEDFDILLKYSPFLPSRFDRIYISNKEIEYDSAIHVYRDLSLCLYHPRLDKPLFRIIPLFKMIPWITEWCIHYMEWKRYGIWLGNEVKHW